MTGMSAAGAHQEVGHAWRCFESHHSSAVHQDSQSVWAWRCRCDSADVAVEADAPRAEWGRWLWHCRACGEGTFACHNCCISTCPNSGCSLAMLTVIGLPVALLAGLPG